MGRFITGSIAGFGLCALALTVSLNAKAQDWGTDGANYETHSASLLKKQRELPRYLETESVQAIPEGQKDIISAQERGKGLNFVEVHDVQVVRVLPDDLQGRRHQKWMVQLANGRNLLAVYNSDMGERIPLKVGESVSMGGQYIWDRGGGLIHWLHEDPKGRRPDGYVEVDGVRYGEVEH